MSDFYEIQREIENARRGAELSNKELRESSPERRQKAEDYAKRCLNEALQRSKHHKQNRSSLFALDLEPLEILMKFLALLACLGFFLWLFITVAKWFWQHPLW
jgi:hypothetical protein